MKILKAALVAISWLFCGMVLAHEVHPTHDNMCGAHDYGACTTDSQWVDGYYDYLCHIMDPECPETKVYVPPTRNQPDRQNQPNTRNQPDRQNQPNTRNQPDQQQNFPSDGQTCYYLLGHCVTAEEFRLYQESGLKPEACQQ